MNKNYMKSINYRLWFALILTSLMPLIYSTVRVYFLGSIPNTWTFSIAAQVTWLNVGYEVLSEALLVPLSYILGEVLSDNEEFNYRTWQSLKIIVSSYFVVTAFVIWFTPELVLAMQQQYELIDITVKYIRLESLAIFISAVYAYFTLIIILKNENTVMYKLLLTQMILMVVFDSLLVSQLPFSLALGINGVAISNVVVNLVLAVMITVYISKSCISNGTSNKKTYKRAWLNEWARIGLKSGLESFVRNIAFIVMILQLINEVKQAGTYWLANQFIWGWLLLPVLALGKLVTQDAAINNGISSSRVNSYFCVTAVIVLAWVVTFPMWESFIHNVMGVKDSKTIMNLVLLLVAFYVIFSMNNVIDSYFYGVGRTDLMLYQSLMVNGLFYGVAYLFYQRGIFVPSAETISLMFGFGITVDAIITWCLYYMHRNNQNAVSINALSECK
ncbi:MAG: MATE family Na+-driven efflux transporter [Shewanella sp.]